MSQPQLPQPLPQLEHQRQVGCKKCNTYKQTLQAVLGFFAQHQHGKSHAGRKIKTSKIINRIDQNRQLC